MYYLEARAGLVYILDFNKYILIRNNLSKKVGPWPAKIRRCGPDMNKKLSEFLPCVGGAEILTIFCSFQSE